MITKDIIKYGVLIGSRAYEVNKIDSDYDIVITEDDYYIVCEKNDAESCSKIDTESEDSDGYEFSIFGSGLDDIAKFKSDDGDTINIFMFTDEIGKIDKRLSANQPKHIYERFKKHNRLMLEHSKEELNNRDRRIELFISYLEDCGITEAKEYN